ncbi:hypothetical protein L1987_12155 [Smallanthus sonchifolius]|uniref:Uncharacterized protein n=1 Tax=Smallanthus sonchifolius TaxID=185202 RepID=A0ACB9JF41_9ASTR|nr:hypothetical protein L1987_12155 [Smallanthus sonchifolius]
MSMNECIEGTLSWRTPRQVYVPPPKSVELYGRMRNVPRLQPWLPRAHDPWMQVPSLCHFYLCLIRKKNS